MVRRTLGGRAAGRLAARGTAVALAALLLAPASLRPAALATPAPTATDGADADEVPPDTQEAPPAGGRGSTDVGEGAPGPSPSPSPAPSPREPRPEVTIPADPQTAPPRGTNRCERGQYGDVLPDGTVDARCDGRLGLAEQQDPTTLRGRVRALVGESVTLSVDERDVPGRVLRVDRVSARGGTITRFPLLYVGPVGIEGRDAFSLWALQEDGYQREVRVVVDVERTTGAQAADGPARGVLVGEQQDATTTGRIAAFERSTSGWLLPLVLVVLLLGVLGLGWGAARRRGVAVGLPEAPARHGGRDGPATRTTFTAGGRDAE